MAISGRGAVAPASSPCPPPLPPECTESKCKYGGSNVERFGEPVLWVGIYVLLASIVCAAAMGADILRSLRWGKIWISTRFFVLNAAVLTILGVATKIPSDINSPMPGVLDQHAKLSGILLLCLAMTHAMPSLLVMDNWGLLSNMVALGILVVTTAVNVLFQIHTGVITKYAALSIVYTIVMLLMFSMLVSYSLSVASVRRLLEKQYQCKHSDIRSEVGDRVGISGQELKTCVKKYWLMALTSGPDFAVSTSVFSDACMILYMMMSFSFACSLLLGFHGADGRCYAESDYKWTPAAILFVQFLPVIVGIASISARFFNHRGQATSFRKLLHVEDYTIQQLGEWKRDPLPFLVRNERARRAAYHAKNLGVHLLLLFQRFESFLIRFPLAAYINFVLAYVYIIDLICSICPDRSGNTEGNGSSIQEEDLSGYVFLLEEADPKVDWKKKIEKKWKDYPDRWFTIGRDRSPHRLLELVNKSPPPPPPPPSDAGVSAGPCVPRLRTTSIRRSRSAVAFELLGGCWSLHLATLMCVIYAAFSGTGAAALEALERALDEGFLYFTLVDANNGRWSSKKALKAAKMVWENLRFRREWLGQPLVDKQLPPRNFDQIIEDLKGKAAGHAPAPGAAEHDEEEDLPEQPSLEAVAAESMSRVTRALHDNSSWSFEEMEAEVAAVAESCLAGLPTAIFRECSNGRYGYREWHVRLAAQVLGETETILESLEARRGLGSSNAAGV